MTDKEIFERDGFLEVPEIIIDPKNLFTKPPKNHNGSRTSGSLKYNLRQEPQYDKDEKQVPGSFSVYNNPKYREIHRLVRRVVQNLRHFPVGKDVPRLVSSTTAVLFGIRTGPTRRIVSVSSVRIPPPLLLPLSQTPQRPSPQARARGRPSPRAALPAEAAQR